MQIQGFDAAKAMQQVTQAAQTVNQINQKAVDANQEMTGKLLSMNAEAKLGGGQGEQGLDLRA